MEIYLETQKWCNVCKTYKDFDEFYKKRDRLGSACKCCAKTAKKSETYKESERKRRRNKYWGNDEFRQEVKEKVKIYRSKNIEQVMLSQAKNRAKENNLEFNLEKSDIKIPKYCPLLNIELKQGPRNLYQSPSLDRIDITKGYVKGNVAVISIFANMMKNKATLEELNLFHKNLPKYIKQIGYLIKK